MIFLFFLFHWKNVTNSHFIGEGKGIQEDIPFLLLSLNGCLEIIILS